MSNIDDRISKLSRERLTLLAIDLYERLDKSEKRRSEPLAIVGMGCRFPGGSNGPEDYWRLLSEGVDAIGEVPPERWDIDAYYDPDPDAPGKMTTRWGGFVDDIDRFDAEFFGISPREAASMDPQQRLLLEVAWEALEHAGIPAEAAKKTLTGVYVGICSNDYFQLLAKRGAQAADTYLATGGSHSFASGRLSYFLGLRGPAVSIDTACSSSLMAVHQACRALRAGECNIALAAGVNALLWPESTITMSRARAMAPDGRCKAFDARADGFVRGEGCGVVVIKRLADAEAAGDRVLALIRGSATNQDGRSNGLTAPNGPSQQAVIREALADGGVSSADVSYVETHGTGTPLGDPIEVQALGNVLAEGRHESSRVTLGSVKANIGHLEAAAGIAGLVKVVLAMQHRQIPPLLHFQKPSPHIDWQGNPIRVPTELEDWNPPTQRRIAGISSFGLSGSNVHAVVEEPPALPEAKHASDRPVQLLPISARTPAALDALVSSYGNYLDQTAESLGDIAHTASVGRTHFSHRLAIVGESRLDIASSIHAVAAGSVRQPGVARSGPAPSGAPSVVFLFPGQGAQNVGMVRELYEVHPAFRACLDHCDEILRSLLEVPLLSLLYPSGAEDASLLRETRYTQPALFAMEYALAKLWQSWGVEPGALVGHSLGEYVAACVAGVFDVEAGLRLVAARGRLSQALPGVGAMASIFVGAAEVESELESVADKVTVAALNGPENTVISGERDAVEAIMARFTARGVESRRLEVSYAGHSPMVDPMLEEFLDVASAIDFRTPQYDYYSTLSGRQVSEEVTSAAYWQKHVREPVQFWPAMLELHKAGHRVFLEVGPHSTLLGLGRQCLPPSYGKWLPSLRRDRSDWQQLMETLAELYVEGVDPNWDEFDRPFERRRIAIPTYPFRREHHWLEETAAPASAGHLPRANKGVLGQRVDCARGDVIYESVIALGELPFLNDHRMNGRIIAPAPLFLEWAQAAAKDALAQREVEVLKLEIFAPMILCEQSELVMQVVVRTAANGAAQAEIFSRASADAASERAWTLHANCSVTRVDTGEPTVDVAEDTLSSIRDRCPDSVSAEEHYARLAQSGVEFGPRFQGIRRMFKGAGEALAEIETPEALADGADFFGIHPAVLDACLQTLGACVPDPSPGGLYVLTALERYRLVRPPVHELLSHVRLRPSDSSDPDTLTADVRVLTRLGELVAVVDGMQLSAAAGLAKADPFAPASREWLHEINWEVSTASAPATDVDAAECRWLILADAAGTGRRLAEQAKAQGHSCVLVTAGARFESARLGEYTVDPLDPASLDALLRACEQEHGKPVGIVHLLGLDVPEGLQDRSAASDAEVGRGCRTALLLTQAMIRSWPDGAPHLWLVTRGAQPAGSDRTLVAPAQAALWGLGRTVAGEHPELWGGLIDLDPSDDEAHRGLLRELLSGDDEDQVALRAGRRFVARLDRLRSSPADSSEFHIAPDGTHLVTGATGGIGLSLVRWLADQGARHLALMARHQPNDEAERVFAALRDEGVQVSFFQADVARESELAEAFSRMEDSMPALRGVYHLAGVFDDSVVTGLKWEQFEKVFAPKVWGSWNLHAQTRDCDLDVFAIFASGASFLGPIGLANYAAANAFQDALALHRRGLGLAGVSIDWGPWAGTGMAEAVGAEREAQWQRGGLGAIPVDAGLQTLGRILLAQLAHVAVLPANWRIFAEARGSGPLPPLFKGVVAAAPSAARSGKPEDERGGKGSAESGLDRAELLGLSAEERLQRLEAFLRNSAAAELGMRAADLDPALPLVDAGFDSLMGVQLKNRLQSSIGVSARVSLFVAGLSARALAKEIEALLEEGSTTPLQSSSLANPDDLLANLDNLSAEQIESLLNDALSETEEDK
jgi:acyl transferase domain-containing protein